MEKTLQRKFFIGVFDSGFGGLDVLREIVKELPEYSYIYLGDTSRAPYGSRSPKAVHLFTKQAIEFLFKKGCQLIILACNTASSGALRKIQQEYMPKYEPGKKVLGVIIPTAEVAATKTKNQRIGVIATEGTVKSRAFERELKKINPQIKVFQQACPLLVPIVEAGEQNSKTADIEIKKYLAPLKAKKIDTLILGCTHYGILKEKIKKAVGKNIEIITEGRVVSEKLADYLIRHPEIERKLLKKGKISFLTTDLTDRFKILGGKFFGKEISPQKTRLD